MVNAKPYYKIALVEEKELTIEEAQIAAAKYLEKICLSSTVMYELEIKEVREIRAVIEKLRG